MTRCLVVVAVLLVVGNVWGSDAIDFDEKLIRIMRLSAEAGVECAISATAGKLVEALNGKTIPDSVILLRKEIKAEAMKCVEEGLDRYKPGAPAK